MISKTASIDNYISGFPTEVQQLLQQLRATIKQAAPGAEEAIKYGIPTLIWKGNLVHFGGYKNHIGFYPGPSGIKAFEKELAVYEGSKGTIKFPLNKPLPLDLVARLVQYRIKQNQEKEELKVSKKKS